MEKNLEQPKVSVIIPTHNSEKTLSECLKSIFRQNCPFCETIIVDNLSSDGTLQVANSFRAKIIRQRCNPALARNIGLTNSTGKYVFFLDSDQVLSSFVIKECVERCETEEIGMLVIPEVFIGRDFWSFCSAVWKNYYEVIGQLHSKEGTEFHGMPRFFAKEHVTRVGMFNTCLVWGEDYDLYERLKRINVREGICKSKLYHYELLSIKEITIKDLRYGRSMNAFLQQTSQQIFPRLLKNALLTFREVLRNFWDSPSVILGCLVLLCLKAYSMNIGLLSGWLKSR